METIRDMRIRLKSISSTKQITESMRLISTSKVQKIRTRIEANRPYFEKSVKIIDAMLNDSQFRVMKNAYINGNNSRSDNPLIILITGDRGLCGSYNVNAEKEAYALVKKLGGGQLITIGSKGREYFRRRQKNIIQSFKGFSDNPFYEDAQNIAASVIKMYDDNSVGEVYFVYTEYKSMLSQKAQCVRLLPLDLSGISDKIDRTDKTEKTGNVIEREFSAVSDSTDYDSDKEIFIKNAVSAYMSSVMFSFILESALCEQCARITGMDSAVKNSDKIIDSLTLQYNQMRQSLITQEIAEIVGGANTFGK